VHADLREQPLKVPRDPVGVALAALAGHDRCGEVEFAELGARWLVERYLMWLLERHCLGVGEHALAPLVFRPSGLNL